jgi:hypothetical protein
VSHVVKAAVVVAVMVVSGLSAPRRAAAYSVLAHEANIDALWAHRAFANVPENLRSNLVLLDAVKRP